MNSETRSRSSRERERRRHGCPAGRTTEEEDPWAPAGDNARHASRPGRVLWPETHTRRFGFHQYYIIIYRVSNRDAFERSPYTLSYGGVIIPSKTSRSPNVYRFSP